MTPGAAVWTAVGLGGSAGAESEVGPGLIGFLATFAVVLVTVLLMLDMTRRLRRLRFRADQLAASERAGVDEETGAGAGAAGSTHTGGSTEPTSRQAGRALGPEADDERDR